MFFTQGILKSTRGKTFLSLNADHEGVKQLKELWTLPDIL